MNALYLLWKKYKIVKYKIIHICGVGNKINFAVACNHNRQRQDNVMYVHLELKYLHQEKVPLQQMQDFMRKSLTLEHINFQ